MKWMTLALAFFGCGGEAPERLTTGAGRFLVVATDFQSGSYGRFDPNAEPPAYEEVGAADADPVVRVRDGHVFLLGRAGSNVTELDPADLAIVRQVSVADEGGGIANPHDICLAGDKAYALRYEQATIAIVDLARGALTGTIDLASFADADGNPEMESCFASAGRLYVALERLDRASYYFPCAGESYLVAIDTETDEVVDLDPDTAGVQGVTLAACNPLGEARLDAAGASLLYAETGA